MSAALVWECVKNSHAFVRKGINGVVFSAEAGNLYNKNSFKYSGSALQRGKGVAACMHPFFCMGDPCKQMMAPAHGRWDIADVEKQQH